MESLHKLDHCKNVDNLPTWDHFSPGVRPRHQPPNLSKQCVQNWLMHLRLTLACHNDPPGGMGMGVRAPEIHGEFENGPAFSFAYRDQAVPCHNKSPENLFTNRWTWSQGLRIGTLKS